MPGTAVGRQAETRPEADAATHQGSDPLLDPRSAPEPVTAIVLNLQRFSTHDGPGIRTTVFLKGCTNACAWCHNPESLRRAPEVQTFPERCIGCGRCLEVCPEQAHRLVDGEKVFDRDRCRACGRCVEECFSGGLTLAGKSLSVEAVVEQIRQDEVYYRRSGGGVTFSGGEPVLHRPFLREALGRCRNLGIHTAIQTAGNYPWEWLEELIPVLDLALYDLKAADPELHQTWVGNDGRRSRANLQRLDERGVPLIVRTPVIGSVNDDEAEIEAIARFLAGLGHLRLYELIPYHPLGESKRRSLGLPPEDRFYTPDPKALTRLARIARRHLPEVRP
jgi:pyruvate formate lyase activating enzyme